jgi:adenylosuccinate synthase
MGKIYVTVGLHFGDEGKGTIVDFLTRELAPATIVRYSGGPQAAHNVITNEGLHHTFAQLGSGMFVNGTKTVLGEHMLIEPSALMYEEDIFRSKVNREINDMIYIDENCHIISPYDKGMGRITSLVFGKSTCGMGVGAAAISRDYGTSVQVKDIPNTKLLEQKLKSIRFSKLDKVANLIGNDAILAKLFQEMLNLNIEKVMSIYKSFYNRYNVVDTIDFISKDVKNNNLIFEGS